jgi:hypothetical protein
MVLPPWMFKYTYMLFSSDVGKIGPLHYFGSI